MTPTESKAVILASAKQLLQPLGFRKSGSLFLSPSQDLIHLIEVQASRKNTAAEGEFTVNVGIFVPDLVYPDVRDVTKPSIPCAHWRQRIGYLCPEQQDLWWKVSSLEMADAAAQDIANRIRQFALPALVAISNIGALVALWQSGRSPGLTEYERNEYLGRLVTQ